jgi:glycosyltransferase involved in cell wall biosynthesis
MEEKPLCTIIVPTVGRPKYFEAALASVLAQTYRPLNVLVSDNAADPPVECAEIGKRAPGVKVRLVRHPARLEPAAHINFCLEAADGEYVFLMSDDDVIVPGYIAASMECILSDPSVNAVIAHQTSIGESFFGPVSNSPIHFKILTGDEFVPQWLVEGKLKIWTTFPMMARRRQVLECGGLPEYPDASHSSNALLLQLCLGAKLGLLDGGYYYRVYPTSGGLATPWRNLVAANRDYERDLLHLHQQGRLERKLFLALVRGDTHLLVGRWNQLYRRRPGFENKVRPIFDIASRIFNLGRHYGLGAILKLQKHFR